MNQPRSILRTSPFWKLFTVSVLAGMSGSATAPSIPVYVEEVLHGSVDFAGVLISFAPLIAIISMPLGGLIAERFGYRRTAFFSGLISASGLLMFALSLHPALATFARLLYGGGNAALLILTLTSVVALASPRERGRALSIYGMSVWISITLGPQLATLLGGAPIQTVFLVCAGTELAMGLLFLTIPTAGDLERSKRSIPTAAQSIRQRLVLGLRVFRTISVAGAIAASAWCAQGLMMGFLIIHLTSAGLPGVGLFGAASIFGVFALSVIVSRIALADLPDRFGPRRTAIIALATLSTGLTLLAFSNSFAFAAVSAVFIGIGFSPLYPALIMLATARLQPSTQAFGLGLFGGFTNLGLGLGALLGGFVIAVAPSLWAFLIAAVLQLIALLAVTFLAQRDAPQDVRSESRSEV